ncbi:MAG: ABC transporter ATP-binding protein [Planctomycetes bacterium]|nr:ABC transporter ATP-binding protein [Planctomycetota bacterium]
MSEPIIVLEGLEKRYGSIRALEGLSLALPPGPIGLLGPNGAGKSTLIKLLLGQLEPSGGKARIAGFDPTRRAERLALRRKVGYMPESDCLIPRMNGVELVTALGQLTGLTPSDAITRAHEVLDYVGLEEARYRGLDEYSTGMKQRLKLAQALVHDPELLLLDEPTNGLDPKGRKHMLELVHDLGHAQGKSILLCSHLLPDVERTCERIVVLDKGKIRSAGSIEELTRNEESWVHTEIDGDVAAFRAALGSAGLQFEPEGAWTQRVRLRAGDYDGLFELAARAGAALTELTSERSSLEEVFLDALEDGVEKDAAEKDAAETVAAKTNAEQR